MAAANKEESALWKAVEEKVKQFEPPTLSSDIEEALPELTTFLGKCAKGTVLIVTLRNDEDSRVESDDVVWTKQHHHNWTSARFGSSLHAEKTLRGLMAELVDEYHRIRKLTIDNHIVWVSSLSNYQLSKKE